MEENEGRLVVVYIYKLVWQHFGGNNGKEKISGILRVVLDRLSPGRSAADREAAEASTMEMGDFDAPNKFEVTPEEYDTVELEYHKLVWQKDICRN